MLLSKLRRLRKWSLDKLQEIHKSPLRSPHLAWTWSLGVGGNDGGKPVRISSIINSMLSSERRDRGVYGVGEKPEAFWAQEEVDEPQKNQPGCQETALE